MSIVVRRSTQRGVFGEGVGQGWGLNAVVGWWREKGCAIKLCYVQLGVEALRVVDVWLMNWGRILVRSSRTRGVRVCMDDAGLAVSGFT